MKNHCIKAATYINHLANCKVIAAIDDGHKLLHYLHNEKILPDIVLLDVEMHGLNGVITAEYMTMFFPSIKIIAFFYQQSLLGCCKKKIKLQQK